MTRQRAPEPVNTGAGGSGTAREARVLRPRPQATTPPPTAAPLPWSPAPPTYEAMVAALPGGELPKWKGLLRGDIDMRFVVEGPPKSLFSSGQRRRSGRRPPDHGGAVVVTTTQEMRWRLLCVCERALGGEAPLSPGQQSSLRREAVKEAAGRRKPVLDLGACLWAKAPGLPTRGDLSQGLFRYAYKGKKRRSWRLLLRIQLEPVTVHLLSFLPLLTNPRPFFPPA